MLFKKAYKKIVKPHIDKLADSKERVIRVVSYNIRLSRNIEKAIKLIEKDDNLRNADIYCLQEMTSAAVERIAKALKYEYIYYPTKLRRTRRFEIGNAVLSKYPIVDECKIELPTFNKRRKSYRNATGATLLIDNKQLTVFSVHKEVILKSTARKSQIKIITNALVPHIPHCIIAGDFNTFRKIDLKSVYEGFQEEGLELATGNVDWTYKHWYLLNKKSRLDHIFTRKMETVRSGSVINRKPSDHLPIWAELIMK